MHRRKVLIGCSTVLTGVLAGCGGGDGGSDEETPTDTPDATSTPKEVSLEDGSDGSTPTESPTATPTETPTATPTETPTASPTPTPTPRGNVQEFNTRFTVGEGDNAVTYRIMQYFRSDRIGNAASREVADGTFLVVKLELTNPRDDRLFLSRDAFRVKAPQTWHKYHKDATEKIDSDSRIDVPNLKDTVISSGDSVVGAVAFDVNPAYSYRVWIRPTGPAETPEYFVEIGEISEVQQL